MNLAIVTSHAGGVALAVKVPGRSHRAARVPPIRKIKPSRNSHLIRLNMGTPYESVYLVGDFCYKSESLFLNHHEFCKPTLSKICKTSTCDSPWSCHGESQVENVGNDEIK